MLKRTVSYKTVIKQKFSGVHLYLGDVGEADDEGYNADNEDEEFLSLPQDCGIFIH